MSIDTTRDGYVAFTWAWARGAARLWSARLLRIDPEHSVLEDRMDGGGSWRWLLGASLDGDRMSWLRGCVLGACGSADEALRTVTIGSRAPVTRPLGGVDISASRGNGRVALVRAAGYGVAAADGHPRCRSGSDPRFGTAPGCAIELLDG
jgi:hypothetical protein